MLKEEEASVYVLGPPFTFTDVISWLKSFMEAVTMVITNPELMAIIAVVALSSALLATLLRYLWLWFTRRRKRRKGLWMSEQERVHRVNRDVADVVNDVVWEHYAKGNITKAWMYDYLNRLAKGMKSKELQPAKKTRGPLSAGYQQRLCYIIRNRLSGPLYWMADKISGEKVKAVANIPGDPPPVIEPKPLRQKKGKLSLK